MILDACQFRKAAKGFIRMRVIIRWGESGVKGFYGRRQARNGRWVGLPVTEASRFDVR